MRRSTYSYATTVVAATVEGVLFVGGEICALGRSMCRWLPGVEGWGAGAGAVRVVSVNTVEADAEAGAEADADAAERTDPEMEAVTETEPVGDVGDVGDFGSSELASGDGDTWGLAEGDVGSSRSMVCE
jgi:hypothetical protein